MADITIPEIERITHAALVNHGAAEHAAVAVARATADSESHGNKICGLYYLESYCQQLKSGRVNGTVEPVVTHPRPGHVRVDAGFGFAQPAFAAALNTATQAARDTGTASLAVCHAHTCTSLGFFTEQIARAGFIAMGFTNAAPVVSPPGGRARIVGTNPIAFAVPDGTGGLAMQFDFSTSASALGAITMAKAAGESIPDNWAVDADGAPTTDPAAALNGSLISAAGHKGWGLATMVELMAAGMTGGRNSVDLQPLKAPDGPPHDLGQFYLLIDPGLSPDFGARFDRLAGAVSDDPGARLPGSTRKAATTVHVPDDLWAKSCAFAGM
jgi:(2R)-3-sulfolactate dehydrogenase (NADP+)